MQRCEDGTADTVSARQPTSPFPPIHITVYRRYDRGVGRTNIVIDDELIARAMQLYGLRTKREAVEFALRRLVGDGTSAHQALLELEGIGWEGDLEVLRRGRFPDS